MGRKKMKDQSMDAAINDLVTAGVNINTDILSCVHIFDMPVDDNSDFDELLNKYKI